MNNQITQSIRLVFKDNRSHKEYNAYIENVDNDLHTVSFAYGRVGKALTTGQKTPEPVSLEKAQKIYHQLVNSKVKKGYQPDGNSTAMQTPNLQPSHTPEFLPQLSNPVTQQQVHDLLSHTRFVGQTKYDGERRIIRFANNEVTGLNRRGLPVPLSKSVHDAVAMVCLTLQLHTLILDTEDMGDSLRVFDLIAIDDKEHTQTPFEERLAILSNLSLQLPSPINGFDIVLGTLVSNRQELTALIAKNKDEEGVILRDAKAPYTAGRPNSLGDSLKIKHWRDLSCVVTSINDKRSMAVSVYEENHLIPIGNVTIPVSSGIPQIGDVVDLRYLWVLQKGGALIQPTFIRNRTGEILPNECTAEQIFYKQAS